LLEKSGVSPVRDAQKGISLMSKQAAVSGLTRARNSLRPFFNKRRKAPYWKELQAVRQETPTQDLAAVCAFAESNSAYPFPGIGNTFPRDASAVPNIRLRHLKPLELSRELALQVARLNHHEAPLLAALQSLAEVNNFLVRGELENAELAVAAHKRNHGVSLAIVKKELLLGLERQGLPGLSKKYKTLTSGIEKTAWALLCHYVYDAMDPTFDAGRAARIWLRLAHTRMTSSEWYARVLEQGVLAAPADESTLSSAILRYSTVSLIDLAFLIWRSKHTYVGSEKFENGWKRLQPSLQDALFGKFSSLPIPIPAAYYLSSQAPPDIELYRTTFFFDEIAEIASWRASLNRLAFSDFFQGMRANSDSASLLLDGAAGEIAAAPEKAQEIIANLTDWELGVVRPGSSISDQRFLAATLVAESLRRIDVNGQASPNPIANLLATTQDVHHYVSQSTLENLITSKVAESSPILRFLLRELMYRKERSPDNELERRLSFMDLFIGGGKDDIVPYLSALYEKDPLIALILARTCTRTFLERLYLLMGSVKDVIEIRLALCRWLEFRAEEPDDSLKEERDALERELANLDARSDLDSTRVHVDEESLREWFVDTQLANVVRYAQTVIAEGVALEHGSLLSFHSNTRERHESEDEDLTADTQIGSEFLLVGIVDATLKAFASDRMFGLDSYLSRRIRHGTLSGHIMTPVNRVLKRLSEKSELHGLVHNSATASAIDTVIGEWSKFLVSELDHARKDVIQVRTTAHPNGLIQATWRSAANVAHLDATIARVRGRVLETKGSYDPFSDIYAFCWDCLESDLARLRLYMVREFLPRTLSRLHELFENLSSEERNLSLPLLFELRETLEARIQEVCGWFIRPVFRRDKYDLRTLINSTLSIVRELDDRFIFTEEVVMSDEVSLNRGSFEVVGDALFVLVGNAARHGKSDGKIRVSARQLARIMQRFDGYGALGAALV
jgi:hypothetical protein